MRHSKEQAARFSFGFWLWRLGATGRYSTFSYGSDYHYGTARQSSPWEPYYTLLGVVGGNACPALRMRLDENESIPARDLLLIREGITDYRYLHTLDRLLALAESKGRTPRRWRRSAHSATSFALSLDLSRYYEARTAAYAENWRPRADNPWTHSKFHQVRRQVAKNILALQKALPR